MSKSVVFTVKEVQKITKKIACLVTRHDVPERTRDQVFRGIDDYVQRKADKKKRKGKHLGPTYLTQPID